VGHAPGKEKDYRYIGSSVRAGCEGVDKKGTTKFMALA
jgi:hypothetical protein